MATKVNSAKVFIIAIISISVLLIALLIGSLFMKDKAGYTLVSKNELATQMKSDERFAIVLSRTWCSYCDEYKRGALKRYQGDIQIYLIELDEEFYNTQNPNIINGLRYEDFVRFNDYLREIGLGEFVNIMNSMEYYAQYQSNRVLSPTTLLIEDGKLISYQIGVLNEEQLDAFLNQ